jgi:hypothetical protein
LKKHEGFTPKIKIEKKTDGTPLDALKYHDFNITQILENEEVVTINKSESKFHLCLFRNHWYVVNPKEKPQDGVFSSFKFEKDVSNPSADKRIKNGKLAPLNVFYDLETVYRTEKYDFYPYKSCFKLPTEEHP